MLKCSMREIAVSHHPIDDVEPEVENIGSYREPAMKFKNVMELAYHFVGPKRATTHGDAAGRDRARPAIGRQNVGDSIGAAQPGHQAGFFERLDEISASFTIAAGLGDKIGCS
jgi:hypothetical protein